MSANDACMQTVVSSFESQRGYLLGLAYRMTGSWSDAEDIVQDAWLRWHRVAHEKVESPRAYLSRTVTRLCLDLFKSARARREEYVGMWLPEPVHTPWDDASHDPESVVHDLSLALMLALERLSPLERAAFLLHDVFDVPFQEIAQTLRRTEVACRQLATRARKRVNEARPRYRVSEDEGRQIAVAFLHASRDGHMDALHNLLAKDAVLYTDGGGKKRAALVPIFGADKIARFYAGIASKGAGYVQSSQITRLNTMPSILAIEKDGQPRTTSFEILQGKIAAIYLIRNPDKLRHMQTLAKTVA